VSSAQLEIIELANGDVVLQRAGGEGEALVRIRFSAEARSVLRDSRLTVAREMIEAGIHATARLSGGEAELDYVSGHEDGSHIVH